MGKKEWRQILGIAILILVYGLAITIKFFNMYEPLLYLAWAPPMTLIVYIYRKTR